MPDPMQHVMLHYIFPCQQQCQTLSCTLHISLPTTMPDPIMYTTYFLANNNARPYHVHYIFPCQQQCQTLSCTLHISLPTTMPDPIMYTTYFLANNNARPYHVHHMVPCQQQCQTPCSMLCYTTQVLANNNVDTLFLLFPQISAQLNRSRS